VRDHEIALFATVLGLLWLMSGPENTTGLLTFCLLWVMRISTKLNIYLGARHAISDMLPDRLSYLKSYFRTDRTSGWFYVSLCGSAVFWDGWWRRRNSGCNRSYGRKWTLLACFAALALLEHLFLVLPVRDSALWAWAAGNYRVFAELERHAGGFPRRRGTARTAAPMMSRSGARMTIWAWARTPP
jgi:putative photosynthetic complex assembly protein 2